MSCQIARLRQMPRCGIPACDECYGPEVRWMKCVCGWAGTARDCGGVVRDSAPGVIDSACPECGARVTRITEVT